MANPKITTEIENVILQWKETSAGNGDFGARTFLYRGKDFGHIHKDGDWDKTMIRFRKVNLIVNWQNSPKFYQLFI